MSLGTLLYATKEFRSIGQLIVEWILGLLAAFTLLLSIPWLNPVGLVVGIAAAYAVYRLHVVGAWTRKRVEVYQTALRVGNRIVSWGRVADIRVVATRLEPGLILGSTVYSYVEVVLADVLVRDGPPLRLKLKSEDFATFFEYAKSQMGPGSP